MSKRVLSFPVLSSARFLGVVREMHKHAKVSIIFQGLTIKQLAESFKCRQGPLQTVQFINTDSNEHEHVNLTSGRGKDEDACLLNTT